MTKEIYILNVKKAPNCSNYKIEIIFGTNTGATLKFNNLHFKMLKGHNIKKINRENLILQSYNFDKDIEDLIKDLHAIYAEVTNGDKKEYNYIINWSSL